MTKTNIEHETIYASEKVPSVDELEREIGRIFIEREDIKAAEKRVNEELVAAQELLREVKERNEGKEERATTVTTVKAEAVTSVSETFLDCESDAVKAELVETTYEEGKNKLLKP